MSGSKVITDSVIGLLPVGLVAYICVRVQGYHGFSYWFVTCRPGGIYMCQGPRLSLIQLLVCYL